MARNFGRVMEKMITTITSSTATPSPMIQVMEGLFSTARMIAPTAMIGAKKSMRSIIVTTICIWVMSLVERVISEAVEKVSNSARENFPPWQRGPGAGLGQSRRRCARKGN